MELLFTTDCDIACRLCDSVTVDMLRGLGGQEEDESETRKWAADEILIDDMEPISA